MRWHSQWLEHTRWQLFVFYHTSSYYTHHTLFIHIYTILQHQRLQCIWVKWYRAFQHTEGKWCRYETQDCWDLGGEFYRNNKKKKVMKYWLSNLWSIIRKPVKQAEAAICMYIMPLIYYGNISLTISQKTSHILPGRARYGVSFVNAKSDWSCIIITVVLCVLSEGYFHYFWAFIWYCVHIFCDFWVTLIESALSSYPGQLQAQQADSCLTVSYVFLQL